VGQFNFSLNYPRSQIRVDTRGSPHRLFQGLAYREFGSLAGRDLDFLSGLWISAGSRLAVCHGEGSEAWKAYPSSLFQVLCDGFGDGVDRLCGCRLGDLGLFGHLRDKLGFGHSGSSLDF